MQRYERRNLPVSEEVILIPKQVKDALNPQED